MAAFVLDASVVLAVALQETNRQLAASILGQVVEDGAAVPGIWHVEVGNALMIAERPESDPARRPQRSLAGPVTTAGHGRCRDGPTGVA